VSVWLQRQWVCARCIEPEPCHLKKPPFACISGLLDPPKVGRGAQDVRSEGQAGGRSLSRHRPTARRRAPSRPGQPRMAWHRAGRAPGGAPRRHRPTAGSGLALDEHRPVVRGLLGLETSGTVYVYMCHRSNSGSSGPCAARPASEDSAISTRPARPPHRPSRVLSCVFMANRWRGIRLAVRKYSIL
jgi:hypothetical protein